jgi:hypothetical protein
MVILTLSLFLSSFSELLNQCLQLIFVHPILAGMRKTQLGTFKLVNISAAEQTAALRAAFW